jgi:ElaB/YqjD/DUF883 family membrane-anchored ribosome-binding protein
MNNEALAEGENLLKAASANLGSLASRAKNALGAAPEKLSQVKDATLESARSACDSTNQFVQENPWRAVGLAAGVGLVLGLLMSRR